MVFLVGRCDEEILLVSVSFGPKLEQLEMKNFYNLGKSRQVPATLWPVDLSFSHHKNLLLVILLSKIISESCS